MRKRVLKPFNCIHLSKGLVSIGVATDTRDGFARREIIQ